MSEDLGFEFRGKGIFKSATTYVAKSGKGIVTIVLEVPGQYPELVPIKLLGTLAQDVEKLKPGMIVEAHGRVGGKEWNGKVFGENAASYIGDSNDNPCSPGWSPTRWMLDSVKCEKQGESK